MTKSAHKPLADQAARDAIATALDETLVVEAAAGTGKTTELVKRILQILATGRAQVHQIVAVTFTEKAAGELKLRLREALERERVKAADAEVRGRLDAALGSLEEAHVNTIHGFCAELLRERPVEAGIDPLFAVLTETESQRLFDEAFGAWLQAQLRDPPEGVRRALRRPVFAGFGAAPRKDGPVERLRRAAWDLADWRDFTAPWTRRPFDREHAVERLLDEVRAFAALTANPASARDSLFGDTEPVRRLAQEIALRKSAGAGGMEAGGDVEAIDTWESRLVDLSRDRALVWVRPGRGKEYKPGVPRESVLAALAALRASLDGFRMDADADLAATLQQELAGTGGVVGRYETQKARAGALDFLDLLLKARDLVKGNALVRRGFQQRFTHLFIDEFQDTDPLQAELLLLLASSDPSATDWRATRPIPGRLFIVGDPKQSIYRFRRADVGIYREVVERLASAGARLVELTTSFRSVPNIQACINAAFEPVMTGDPVTLQADYVRLSPHRPDTPGQPSVVVLPVPEPYGTRNLSAAAIEKSLPDAVGALVDWIVNNSGWKVSSPRGAGSGALPGVQARDICILFRRFLSVGEDVTLPYVRALEARGVHHVLVGGKTFHDREEVETLRAALAAIEWPDDELSVFATLRGALFAIGDEELLEWKHHYHRFHPFYPSPGELPANLRPIADALKVLQRLHRRRNYVPVAETIQELLNAARAHVGLVLRAAGEQALANVLHVSELARQYEASGGISFRGFVDELRRAAGSAQAAEAPILEEGSDGVRLMTVHKAKGLEFPVVILADLTCKLSRPDAGRWIDQPNNLCASKIGGWAPFELLLHGAEEAARDKAEAERLAYVAATRARDVLVVPAIGDGPYEGGWLHTLTPAIYPPEPARRAGVAAAGCPPPKSTDSVLNRPDCEPARRMTVAPGLHKDAWNHEVVWWDPQLLHLHAEPSFGLRRDDLIVKDGDAGAVATRLAAYTQWSGGKARVIDAAAAPGLRVQTATAWAAAAAREGIDQAIADGADIEIVELAPAGANRPRGHRFGTLVHAVLATAPLDADAEVVRNTADVQGRMIAAPADEVVAAAAVANSVLRHALMTRARAAERVRRETPVTWLQQDGTLVEGVLDLAFDEGGTTIVVDFKTDHELAAGEARYRAQLHQYVHAISRATGQPAKGILFKV
jgi:ATP-dependent helicase/nuclease subunit A